MKILFIDLTTRLESVNDLQAKGRGGMVASLFALPAALAKLGHEVAVLCQITHLGYYKNVFYCNDEQHLSQHAFNYIDFVVLNRQIYTDGYVSIPAKHRVLWVHDMVHGGWIPDPQKAKILSAIVFMSKYSQETWKAYYKDIGKSFIIPNGVNKDVFNPGSEKDFNKMIYFSAPNRGLYHLPTILRTIRGAGYPKMDILAFSKMNALHPNEKDEFNYQEIKDAGINLSGVLPQDILAPYIMRSCLMLKPNDYAETCSNSTLQALACGTPVITTSIGADKEWVKTGYNGMMNKYGYNDGPLWIVEMCRNILNVLGDRKLHEKLIKNAPKTKNLYSWDEIGKKWEKMLKSVY